MLIGGTVIVGKGFTVIVATAVPVHPFVFPVTVYDVVAVGDPVTDVPVVELNPAVQEYVVPPLAVSVAVCPLQIVGELTFTVMLPPMVIVATAVLEQPLVVPVTV
jgi:hypothetical protein